MIQTLTKLKTVDNSGARRLGCIRIYKKPGRGCGKVGDLLKVSIQKLRNRGNIRVKRGELHYAVVVRTKKKYHRKGGIKVKCESNAAAVLNANKLPFGTRFFGITMKELRLVNFSKVLTLSPKIL